ncbi:MAG: fibrobacter succinogenes major paralogous domain-containing protein [Bacteroidales bacterium]|nr:fibrobacter succinogenes major paralogous domain-containing protein [Bacteroidales bacterium]
MNRIIIFRVILIIAIYSLLQAGCKKPGGSGLPVDADGNEYDTVVIGSQVWLAENLKTTKYNNGVPVPLITDNDTWASRSTAAFCWYDNDPSLKDTYGALYNWWAANEKITSICPAGYHVPSDEEWLTLINYLGGEDIAGDKLKAAGEQFWSSGNYSTNETGFTAMPGSWRSHMDGTFSSKGWKGYWWTSSPRINEDNGYRVDMLASWPGAYFGELSKKSGYSVRCVKDN